MVFQSLFQAPLEKSETRGATTEAGPPGHNVVKHAPAIAV